MLVFWGIAILAGRLTAYSNFVRKQTAVAVVVATAVLVAARYVVPAIARHAGWVLVGGPARQMGAGASTHY